MGIIRFWGNNLGNDWGSNGNLSNGWVSWISQWGSNSDGNGLGVGYESSEDQELKQKVN
jgi:hypothetical protein